MKVFLHLLCLLIVATRALADPPIRPDPKFTPGAVLEVTKEDLCTPGYTKKVRDVPAAVKNQVFVLYGITSHEAGEYEVDHLIPLELGGSNSIRNLFPQSYRTQPWNAHVKDRLENKLHPSISHAFIWPRRVRPRLLAQSTLWMRCGLVTSPSPRAESGRLRRVRET